MSAKKSAPKKRGPKPKPPEEQLQQLTVRMSPKVKYGLELLARAQHRSLSQAVEWALQRGLNSYEIPGRQRQTLGDALDSLWQLNHDAARALLLRQIAPGLLSFDEAAAAELVVKSAESILLANYSDAVKHEAQTIAKWPSEADDKPPDAPIDPGMEPRARDEWSHSMKRWDERRLRRKRLPVMQQALEKMTRDWADLLELNWIELKRMAKEWMEQGKDLDSATLIGSLRLGTPPRSPDTLAEALASAADQSRERAGRKS